MQEHSDHEMSGGACHSHPHTHDHSHMASSPDNDSSLDRGKALLAYYCQHNHSHIQELERLAQLFHRAGAQATADQLCEGLALFRQADLILTEVLNALKEN